MPRKRSVGQPPRDDAEALKAVRQIRADQPRLSYRAAALRYAIAHPEDGVQPASTARRLADKLQTQDGRPPQRRATRRKLLEDLGALLVRAVYVVDALIAMEKEPPEE